MDAKKGLANKIEYYQYNIDNIYETYEKMFTKNKFIVQDTFSICTKVWVHKSSMHTASSDIASFHNHHNFGLINQNVQQMHYSIQKWSNSQLKGNWKYFSH